MASKWLAAFRAEVEDGSLFISEPRAERADNANSPASVPDARPNGTNGTNGTAEQKKGERRHSDLSALKALSAQPEETQALSPTPANPRTVPHGEPGQDAEADDPEERAALVEFGAGVPRRWAEGYAALCSMPAPAGFSIERWHRIVDAAGAFLDRWAAQAMLRVERHGCVRVRPEPARRSVRRYGSRDVARPHGDRRARR
jgi:hypothetical protein